MSNVGAEGSTTGVGFGFGTVSGSRTVGSRGNGPSSNSSPTEIICLGGGTFTELHGLSNGDGTIDGRLFTLAQGLLDEPIVYVSPISRETGLSPSPQGSVSRSRSSDVLSSSSPPPIPFKSLVTPSYASCTTENAADALDDNFPQTDFIPLLARKSACLLRR